MKKKTVLLLMAVFVSLVLSAQKDLQLIFTAKQLNNTYQRLDSVMITNLSRGWTEMVYYPDTTFILSTTTGITDYENATGGIQLYQNTPNPFLGTTKFSLSLANSEKVDLFIFDLYGRKVAEYHNILPSGVHQFRATMGTPQIYIVNAHSKSGTASIKMLNVGNKDDQCRIDWIGSEAVSAHKIKKLSQNLTKKGDLMLYVGFTTQKGVKVTSCIEKKQQLRSESFTFAFPSVYAGENNAVTTTEDASPVGYDKATMNGSYVVNHVSIVDAGFKFRLATDSVDSVIYVRNIDSPFSYELTGLKDNTEYVYKAFVKYAKVEACGEEKHFTTLKIDDAYVFTDNAQEISQTGATLYGSFVTNAPKDVKTLGFEVKAGEGEWKTYTAAETTSPFQYVIADGLDSATTYTYHAFLLTNADKKYVGADKTFTTTAIITSEPVVETIKADTKSYDNRAAKLYGQVVNNGACTITETGFYFGTTKNVAAEGQKIVAANDNNVFLYETPTLEKGTDYYYVAFATNKNGTAYGEVKTFKTTTVTLPEVATISMENVNSDNASVICKILNFGGTENLTFGVVLTETRRTPTIDDKVFVTGLCDMDSLYTTYLSGLKSNVVYRIRAFAQNEEGVVYGNEIGFRTDTGFSCGKKIVDIEGNEYETVKIGNQCWMAENMRSKTLPNGTKLDVLTKASNLMTGRFYYERPAEDKVAGGAILYPWTTAANGRNNTDQDARLQGICPDGWCLPTYRDFADMCRAIDPEWQDGGESDKPAETNPCENSNHNLAVKLASQEGHWYAYTPGNEYNNPDLSRNNVPNTPGYYKPDFNNPDFNASGFNAKPMGYWKDDQFVFDGCLNMWTAISDGPMGYGNYVSVALDKTGIDHVAFSMSAKQGLSVRCVKAENSSYVYYQEFEGYSRGSAPLRTALSNPNRTGYTDCMDLEGIPGETSDFFAVFFDYDLNVEKEDVYTFRFVSDDGGRFSIDGKRIITDGGYHCKDVRLTPGVHKIEIEYAEYNRSQSMTLFCKTPTTDWWQVGLEKESKGIPDFVDAQAKETLKRFNEWKGKDEVLVFPILTDIHTACRGTYKHIGYTAGLDKYFHYDLMVCLGDIGLNGKGASEEHDYSTQIIERTAAELAKYKGVCLYAPGNHDYDAGGGFHYTASELSDIFQKPSLKYANGNLHLKDGNTWCYYDVPEKHTRFIMLNSQIQEGLGTRTYAFGNPQMNWLIDLLNNTPEGMNVIVMSHFMPDKVGRNPGVKCNQDSTTTFAMLSMLTAYANKTQGSEYGLSWDFTKAKGNLVGYMTGDSHVNALVQRDGLNMMIIQGYGRVETKNLTAGTKRSWFNSRNSMNVDVIAVKPATREVHTFRIGGGGEEMDYQYKY